MAWLFSSVSRKRSPLHVEPNFSPSCPLLSFCSFCTSLGFLFLDGVSEERAMREEREKKNTSEVRDRSWKTVIWHSFSFFSLCALAIRNLYLCCLYKDVQMYCMVACSVWSSLPRSNLYKIKKWKLLPNTNTIEKRHGTHDGCQYWNVISLFVEDMWTWCSRWRSERRFLHNSPFRLIINWPGYDDRHFCHAFIGISTQ